MSKNREGIGKVLLDLSRYFKSYEAYCNNFDRANNIINEIEKAEASKATLKFMSKSAARRFLNFLKMAKSHPQHTQINLQSYLILPIQRLPRYKLLLQELIEATSSDHGDFMYLCQAKEYIEAQINHLNEKKREQQDLQDIQEVLTKIAIHSDYVNDAKKKITPHAGKFIYKGELNTISLLEYTSQQEIPIINISIACDRDHYYQQSLLGVRESIFGSISHNKITDDSFRSGKPFYYFKFKNLLICCGVKADSRGRFEYLGALEIDDEEIIAFSSESSLLRLKGNNCILYLEGELSELKRWKHWR